MGKEETKTKDRQPTWCDNVANKLYTTIMIALQSFNLLFSTKSWLWLDTRKIVSYSVHLSIIHLQHVWTVCGSAQRNIVLAVLLATSLMLATAQTVYGVGVDVLKNGTLVANKLFSVVTGNATGNMTDPPKINYTGNALSYHYGYKSVHQSDTRNPYDIDNPPNEICNATYYGSNGFKRPMVTNSTSCVDGWVHAWKNWCTTNSKQCVQDILAGNFPDFLIHAHKEYAAGVNAYDNRKFYRCPIGLTNAAFCAGFHNKLVEEDETECEVGFKGNLVGCPLDHMTHIAGFAPLVGTWHFVNRTGWAGHVVGTGTMTFDNDGNLTITFTKKNLFGDWSLRTSWGSDGHQLTVCPSEGDCYLQFITVWDDHTHAWLSDDNHHYTQYLTKVGYSPPHTHPSWWRPPICDDYNETSSC
jgi:predicted small secreted protein